MRSARDPERAFARAAEAAYPAMVRYARSLIGADLAEDAAQEALLKAWRRLDSYAGRGSVEGWLMQITRTCSFDLVRRVARDRERATRVAEDEPLSTTSHAAAAHLEILVDGLPQTEREPFVLTQLVDLSYAETATVLGIPVGTVRSRVARARRLLHEMLAEAEAS